MPLKTCAMNNPVKSPAWQSQSSQSGTCYFARFDDCGPSDLKPALEICAAKAVSLLDHNIREDSLYLLFAWNPQAAELRIDVTDALKQQDGAFVVQAQFPQLLSPADSAGSLSENIKFLLSDFLASYSPFFSYSLVAIFHSSSRDETCLL
jgi:hypothetical protein